MAKRRKEVELNSICTDRYDEPFKVLFLGDTNVGKTCLAQLYLKEQVVEDSVVTIGFDYDNKDVKLENGISVNLQIWDTAGMEKNRGILTPKLYKEVQGMVLVYDITEWRSFNNLEKWISEIKDHCEVENVQMVLIGNKCDQKRNRKVPTETGKTFAGRNGMAFVETSAKEIDSLLLLEKTFVALAQGMLDKRKKKVIYNKSSESIRVGWETVDTPKEPIPNYVYDRQEASRSSSCSCC